MTESFSAQGRLSERCDRVALYPILFEARSVLQGSRTRRPAEPISFDTLPQPQCSAPELRIPVKWATYSGGKWARLGRASRRGKVMMPQVAHMGQETWGNTLIISSPSFRLRHLVSCGFPVKWATIPVMWAGWNGGPAISLLPTRFACGSDPSIPVPARRLYAGRRTSRHRRCSTGRRLRQSRP